MKKIILLIVTLLLPLSLFSNCGESEGLETDGNPTPRLAPANVSATTGN